MALSKGRQRVAVSPQLIWEGPGCKTDEGLENWDQTMNSVSEATLSLKDVTCCNGLPFGLIDRLS